MYVYNAGEVRGSVSTIGVNSFDIVTLRPVTTSHLRDNGIRNENRRSEDTADACRGET